MCRGGKHTFESEGHYCDCGKVPSVPVPDWLKPGGSFSFQTQPGEDSHEEKVIKLLTEIRDLLKGGRL